MIVKNFLVCILIALLVIALIIGNTLNGWFNTWFTNKAKFIDQKIDDATNYETLKKVEDTCRSMQASYESDRLTYEQYKDSDNEEKQSWAEQAKMRANKTAVIYNEYVLKNSYVWNNNIPSDIQSELPVVD